MTRTARATYPRAINKDRSESRSGLDNSIRKNGAGSHNWGSLHDEQHLEAAALEDTNLGLESEELTRSQDVVEDARLRGSSPQMMQRSNSDEEIEEARKFRKNALHKKNVDLSAIARTSVAASTFPPSSSSVRPAHENKQVPISDTTRIV